MNRQEIAIVVPVYNEALGLDALVARIREVMSALDVDWNVLFVDDGSTDATLLRIRELNAEDARFTAISFSRHFGNETAISAGFRHARGDAVVLMDADLQHPPEIIAQFIERWQEGYKVVFGKRQSRDADSWLRRVYSRAFHGIFRRIAQT